jgi:hypothetical protein
LATCLLPPSRSGSSKINSLLKPLVSTIDDRPQFSRAAALTNTCFALANSGISAFTTG